MSSSRATPTSFITSIIPTASVATSSSSISASIPTITSFDVGTSLPQAPTAGYMWNSSPNDGWTPGAIISIVSAIIIILLMVPLIALLVRKYERKRLKETVKHSAWSDAGSSKSSLKDGSLRQIVVTKELQRTSMKLAEGVDRPEPVYAHGREWSRTEVKGGGLK